MPHERRIWRIVAFLARYGHQQAAALLDFTLADLRELQECIGDLMEDEAKAVKNGMGGG